MYIVNNIKFKTKEAVDTFLLTAIEVRARDCTSLTELSAPIATGVYVSGCTALTEISAPMATGVYVSGCTSLTELSAPKATDVHARDCTALTEITAPMATEVFARNCTSLTELSAPMATEVDANNCTSLTELSVPMATRVYAYGCTALTKCNGYEQLSEAECSANLKVVAALALARPDALDMGTIHTCETTHCISGWAIFKDPNGGDMQSKCGWWVAGKFLLGDEATSHFMDSQEDGITYLQSVINQGE